jgi:AcrR family transcriptional regulator
VGGDRDQCHASSLLKQMINTLVQHRDSVALVSPRHSNRDALIDGALRCLERQGYADIRTRDIAAAAGANLASIGYHFGSKDELLGQALREGFQRWLGEIATAVLDVPEHRQPVGLTQLIGVLRHSLQSRRNLALAFLDAVARAPRDERLRAALVKSYQETRNGLTVLAGLGTDDAGQALASLLIATFDGLLIQWLIDPQAFPSDDDLVVGVDRVEDLLAQSRRTT